MAKPGIKKKSSITKILLVLVLIVAAACVFYYSKYGADSISPGSTIPLKNVVFRYDSQTEKYYVVDKIPNFAFYRGSTKTNYKGTFKANYYKLLGDATVTKGTVTTFTDTKYVTVTSGTFVPTGQQTSVNITDAVGFKFNKTDSTYYALRSFNWLDVCNPISGSRFSSITGKPDCTVKNIASGQVYNVSYYSYKGTLTAESGKIYATEDGREYIEITAGTINFVQTEPKQPIPITDLTSFLLNSDKNYYSTSVQPNICDIVPCTKKSFTGTVGTVYNGKKGKLTVKSGQTYTIGNYTFLEVADGSFIEN